MKMVITIVTTPIVINGLVYACVTFNTVEHANKFIEGNPEFSVIHEEGENVYVTLTKDKGTIPKTKDEVDFYQEADVWYSYQFYKGALMFDYTIERLPRGPVYCRTIFGITKEQGEKLLSHWNTKAEGLWKYTS